MIQAYADDRLFYDSRLQDYNLLELKTETGLNKSGAAYITMPPDHPAYTAFTLYRTVVTIYRDGILIFRGRALYSADDFYRRRTITCEGERGFFRDGVNRPYMYQDSPAVIFETLLGLYNAQVEDFKQFAVGTISVTDPNNYIRLESDAAEPFSDTFDKLVERCGGYIVFTTNGEGLRTANWYTDIGYANNQPVEFGSNLLDFARTNADSDLATVIIPYGAKDEATGTRVTIENVNEGLDFIQDYEAVTRYGVIARAVYWDDITDPQNLLAKAQQYLAETRQVITSLELSAVDLSYLDRNIDSFRVGDIIRVRSKPHGVDDDYQLTTRTMDLLHPEADTITLGKSITSLSGAAAAGDKQGTYGLQRVERIMTANYNTNVAAIVAETEATMASLIQQTSEELRLEVAAQYATGDEVESAIATSMTQLADSFNFLFTELQTVVDANDSEARAQLVEIEKYIRFEDGNILLGETGNELTLRIENDRISFIDDGAEVAYLNNKQLVVLDGHFLHSLRIGSFEFLPRGNGNLSLVKVG